MFTIVITDRCNLKCKYCYEKKMNVNMNKDIADKSIDFWLRNVDKEMRNRVAIHGGEPFLNFDIFKYIAKKLIFLNKDIIIETTSNGTIIDNQIISFIKEYRINLSISLDGIEEKNDENRVFENGKGSFNLVYNNILLYISNNI